MFRAAVAVLAALGVGLTASTSGAAAPGAPSDGHVRRAPVSALVARALGPTGELRAVELNDVGGTGRALTATTADFPRMAADGITTVSVYVYLYVASPTSNVVTTGTNTPTDQELQLVSQAAHQNGLDVHLTPVLLDTATNSWRGRYQPSDPNAFFASYTAQVVKYADLAQQLGVTLFYVGSENDAIATQTARWRALIKVVRRHYSGALAYMSTGYTPLQVKFWDALDLAAISVYFSMGEDENPTYARYLAAWSQVHTPYVRALAKKLKKPLIYAEVGYHSAESSFAQNASSTTSKQLPAPAAQADAYAALLDVLKDNPYVYGVGWWRWTAGNAGPADTSYAPNGKPAECVLAAHWSRDPNVRQAATGTPTCDLHAFDQAVATVAAHLPQ
jgi:hypothetical protein